MSSARCRVGGRTAAARSALRPSRHPHPHPRRQRTTARQLLPRPDRDPPPSAHRRPVGAEHGRRRHLAPPRPATRPQLVRRQSGILGHPAPSACASRPNPPASLPRRPRATGPITPPAGRSSASRPRRQPSSPRSGSTPAPARCAMRSAGCPGRRVGAHHQRIWLESRAVNAERSSVRGRSAGEPLADPRIRRGESAQQGRSAHKARARQLTP